MNPTKIREFSRPESVNHVTTQEIRPDNEIKAGGVYYYEKTRLYYCSHTSQGKFHMTNLATGETFSDNAQNKEYYENYGFVRNTAPVTITPQNI